MWRRTKRAVFFLASVAILLLSVAGSARAKTSVPKHSGSLADGATYLIEVPANWNGTLFLYSHGYAVPGSPNPAQDVGDPFTRLFMLSSGPALAGSSYATTGWAIHEALKDQIAVLEVPQGAIVPVPPAYIEFDPSPYLRPFEALTGECEFGFLCRDPFLKFGLH